MMNQRGIESRPIIFSAEMIRAILDGAKHQTRRVTKQAYTWFAGGTIDIATAVCPSPAGGWIPWFGPGADDTYAEMTRRYYSEEGGFKCPYGEVGDTLWVRETIAYVNGAANLATGAKVPLFGLRYLAGGTPRIVTPAQIGPRWPKYTDGAFHKIPAIFMPRWASRITLEILSIRVERLQDMGASDCLAEGPRSSTAFIKLWDDFNARRGFGWDMNPWVWVIDFRRIDMTTDQASSQ